jgi:hypothetical protein
LVPPTDIFTLTLYIPFLSLHFFSFRTPFWLSFTFFASFFEVAVILRLTLPGAFLTDTALNFSDFFMSFARFTALFLTVILAGFAFLALETVLPEILFVSAVADCGFHGRTSGVT